MAISSLIPDRQRAFVVAHELAHVIITHLGVLDEFGYQLRHMSPRALEETCDRIALELTLPAEPMAAYFPRTAVDVWQLRSVSAKTELDGAIIARRLADLRYGIGFVNYSHDGRGDWLLRTVQGPARATKGLQVNVSAIERLPPGCWTVSEDVVRGDYSFGSIYKGIETVEIVVRLAGRESWAVS